jgi:hypothetical protein
VLSIYNPHKLITLREALSGLYMKQWLEAMQDELKSLLQNETWYSIQCLSVNSSHKVLKGKWVFKIKCRPKGKILRYKACWVIKGYKQQYGINYNQTFAAVVKPMAFCTLFALATYYNLKIDQMDIKMAFLNG